MKYLVRQRFSYTGDQGAQVLIRPGTVLDSSIVNAWRNGAAMIRSGFVVPHDEASEAPEVEQTVARQKTRKKKEA